MQCQLSHLSSKVRENFAIILPLLNTSKEVFSKPQNGNEWSIKVSPWSSKCGKSEIKRVIHVFAWGLLRGFNMLM